MGCVIDILTRATGGADGPKDWPRDCIEHDGALPLAPGAARMTVEEYRAWLAANAATFDEWRAAHPSPEPAPPPVLPPEPAPPPVLPPELEPTAERIIKTLVALTGRSEEEVRAAWREADDAESMGSR